MRLVYILLASLGFVSAVLGWTKDDYEIFDLVSELEAAEGKGTNFYSWLEVEPSSSTSEITKAYRKKSLELHPDKNHGVKNVHERFARLGVINQILRSPERRERYNFFYKNGVPKWRGTGYYYSRFRPTLLHTLTFLVLLTSLFHLLVMRLNFSRDRRRIEYFDRSAKAAAKRGQGKRERFDLQDVVSDGAGKGGEEFGRRVKVPMVEANDMGGLLELVVLDEKVYMPHDDGSLEPLSRLALSPSFFRTWPFLLARSLYTRILTRGQQAASHDSNGQVESDQSNGITAADAIQNARSGPNGTHPSVRKGKAKVTPVDTPETTDLDSEDENEEGSESPAPGANGEGKQKKKRGLGKAGGMRRRKMALKR